MRFKMIAAGMVLTAGLAGCVAPVPLTGPAAIPPVPPVPLTPVTPVGIANPQQVAREAITAQLQNKMQGVDVAPFTDCVMSNASDAELIGIAEQSRSNAPGLVNSVAAIVQRPATGQCIAAAARRT